MRLTKCQYCGKKDRIDKIKKSKGYYHEECYEKFVDNKRQWTELINKIIDIHGIVDKSQIPKDFYMRLNDFCKNGNISYEVVKKTYEYVEKDIKKQLKIKNINSLKGELMYGFKIMQDKINFIQNKLKEREKHKFKLNEIDFSNDIGDIENKYKKKKRKDDISDFV